MASAVADSGAPARRVEGGLQRLLPGRQPHQQLQLALRLHQPADHAETGMEAAVALGRAGHHRVVRALARGGTVDVAGAGEAETAVLQHEAAVRHRDAGAEALEDAAHQRDGEAVGVDHDGADGIAGRVGHGLAGMAHGLAHGAHGLQHGGGIVGGERLRFQRIERVQDGDAMRVGRAFEHFQATEARRHRRAEVAAMLGEVAGREHPPSAWQACAAARAGSPR